MPVVQISEILHRRGAKNSLPTLKEGEIGLTLDTSEVFIGTPNFPKANERQSLSIFPYGNTQILTEFSENTEKLINYTYRYRTQNGPLQGNASPFTQNAERIVRYLQERLDELVSVKSYGAKGNGYLDFPNITSLRSALNSSDPNAISKETFAIRRAAIDTIVTLNNNMTIDGWKKRALYFPAGVYVIENYIPLLQNSIWIGDGKDQTIILMAPQSNSNIPCLTSMSSTVTLNDLDNNLLDNFIGANILDFVDNVIVSGICFIHAWPRDVFRLIRMRDCYFHNCGFGHLEQDSKSFGDWNNNDTVSVLIDTALGNMMPPQNISFDNCDFFNSTYAIFATSDSRCVSFNQCTFTGHYRAIRLGESGPSLTRSEQPTTFLPGGPYGGPSSYRIQNSLFRNCFREAISVVTQNNIPNVFNNIEGVGGFHISSGNRFENCGHGSRTFPPTPLSYAPPISPVINFESGTVYNVSIFDTFDRNQVVNLPVESRVLYDTNDPNIILNPQDPAFIPSFSPSISISTINRPIQANQFSFVDFVPPLSLPANNNAVIIEYSISIGTTFRKVGSLTIIDNTTSVNFSDSFTIVGGPDPTSLTISTISGGTYRIQYTNTSSNTGTFKYIIRTWQST